MVTTRDAPYLWVSWLTKLLVGDQACEWSVWFRAHHKGFAQVPSDFDQAAWMVKHTELRRMTARQLRDDGFEVFVEDQNDWKLADPKYGITLAAKPDIVAAKDGYGIICDAKTGARRASDAAQVMVYLWIARRHPGMRERRWHGQIAYPDETVNVDGAAVDNKFDVTLRELMRRLCRTAPAERVPSYRDCRTCPITAADCTSRLESDPSGRVDYADFGLDE